MCVCECVFLFIFFLHFESLVFMNGRCKKEEEEKRNRKTEKQRQREGRSAPLMQKLHVQKRNSCEYRERYDTMREFKCRIEIFAPFEK